MDIWHSLYGMVEIELTSADPLGAVHAINDLGIELFDLCQTDVLMLRFRSHRRDFRRLRRLADRRGDLIRVSERNGVYWRLKQLLRRPVLLLGIGLIVLLTFAMPNRIYFIEVEGNHLVPDAYILEKAAQFGIGFGANRGDIRSERMKNELLQAIPELQWAGINTYGCRAVISVREKPLSDQQIQEKGISSIVASVDGVIRQITVNSGNRVCTVGQAVRRGQVLISGYTDCGICIRATRAEGEVIADTNRSLDIILSTEYEQKGEIIEQEQKYSLLIGKKQINFSKDSGISTTTYDKMYSVMYMTLPGGFKLPLALVKETRIYYASEPASMNDRSAEALLSDFAERYLYELMTAGQIQHKQEAIEKTDGTYLLHGQYICTEMIGKIRLEENLEYYGKTD